MAPMTEQVNVRVPPEAKDVILRIARLLREDIAIVGKLELYLEEVTATGIGPALAERMERLERRVETLETGRGPTDTPPRTPSTTPRPFETDLTGERVTPDPAWTVGEGRGRRLSPEGDRELRRRLDAHQTDTQISHAMGVATNTVANRRKGLADIPDSEG